MDTYTLKLTKEEMETLRELIEEAYESIRDNERFGGWDDEHEKYCQEGKDWESRVDKMWQAWEKALKP